MSASEAYMTGVGQSEAGVGLTRSPRLLTLDAAKEALAEAGLTMAQIDGVSTYPGRAASYPGFSPIGADELIDAFGIRATWYADAAARSPRSWALRSPRPRMAVTHRPGAACALLPHGL